MITAKPGDIMLLRRIEELEGKLALVEPYAERLKRALLAVRTRVANELGALITMDMIDAALAKNPDIASKADIPCAGNKAESCNQPPSVRTFGQDAEWLARKVAVQGDLDEPAAGGMVLPSCLCCGNQRAPKVWLIDHPEVYVCEACHDASHRPSQGGIHPDTARLDWLTRQAGNLFTPSTDRRPKHEEKTWLWAPDAGGTYYSTNLRKLIDSVMEANAMGAPTTPASVDNVPVQGR